MAIPITIPRLGWNMDEGGFVGWRKNDGDAVRPGDTIFTLEGEKAAEDIECLDAGTLHIPADGPKPGDRVRVGVQIGQLLQPGEAVPQPSKTSPPDAAPSVKASSSTLEPAASPSVRRLARERGIALEHLAGSGPGGRITADDLGRIAALPPIPVPTNGSLTSETRKVSTPRARRIAGELGIDWQPIPGTGRNGRVRERDIRTAAECGNTVSPDRSSQPTQLRRTIAERMLASRRDTAPVTLFATVDTTNLVNLRNQFKAAASATGNPVPSYTDMLVKLTATALQAHPSLNACWTDDQIVTYSGVHVGIAVDAEVGLFVPVVKDVPAHSLSQVAAVTADLIARARKRSLTAKEMRGGTFTITSLGSFGVDAFTPIINAEQCAILGVGQIARRPAVRGNKVVARDQMTLSLTFDHRIVDGAPAARFLHAIVARIEAPGPWLMS